MDSRPVGIFDSGVGGLSVLRHFQCLSPSESVVYFADTAWFPYGPRPAAEVRKRAFAITNHLVRLGCKLIIVACNTASAAAINDLRQAWDVPFVGMVPGVKPGRAASKSGRVVILATEGTFDGELYARVVDEFGKGVSIESVPGAGLAELVERGRAGTAEASVAIRDALGPAVGRGADTVVLGCTHYHFLAEDIATEFPGIAIIDTSEPVARRAIQVLAEHEMVAPSSQVGQLHLVVTGDRAAFFKTMAKLGFVAESSQESPA